MISEERQLQWLWLAQVLGPGAAHSAQVLALYLDPAELLDAVGKEDVSGLLSPAQQRRLQQYTPQDFSALLRRCERLGVRVLTMEEEDYPRRLALLPDAPPVLYCTGDVQALNQPAAVAMIGSRRPSSYGVEAAACIGRDLAAAGVCLVSGLADGLDSEAHKAAVQHNSPTIGVLGTAIDKIYPASNRLLRRQMENGYGAVISEYEPGKTTNAGCFLQRNRLIAGLSDAICVVEAREKSGTMNTVEHAMHYKRPVYAVPGAIFSPLCEGTNSLLDQGVAHAASSAAAILKGLGLEQPGQKKAELIPPKTNKLSPAAAAMQNALSDRAQGLETLANAAGLNAGQALAALLELEVNGLAVCCAAGQYRSR